jgi:8-oxo-dGTP diphosphatase
MNPYESGQQRCIPANLIYAFRKDGRVLMLQKNSSIHAGKWNGLGGKLNPGEGQIEAACREFYEESSIQVSQQQMHPLGVITFPNFKQHEDWLVHVFWTDLSTFDDAKLDQLVSSTEGTLAWVPTDQLLDLNLWEGDRCFLPLVINRTPFIATIWYQNQVLIRSEILPLPAGLAPSCDVL